jgi:integrase
LCTQPTHANSVAKAVAKMEGTMGRVTLTAKKIPSLKPAKAKDGKVADTIIMDAVVPGLGVRLSPKGKKTFVMVARFGGSKWPARRSLGAHGTLTLAEARKKAREWLSLVERGIDPAAVAARAKEEERRYQDNTFRVVAEKFIEKHVARLRTAKSMARTIRSELIGAWGERPIGDITKSDVINLVEEVAARAPYQAHAVFEFTRSLFNWAVDREEFGIEASPCDRLKASRLISAKESRDRVLDDAEIAALWRVTNRIGFPYGHLYKTLLLTGVRRNEAAAAKPEEFDLVKRVWTIPTERFKSKTPHIVPLTAAALAVIAEIPEHNSGYVFSSARFNFALAKAEVDRQMAEELGAEPRPWKTHDLRRTVRTRLASLKVADHVSEMILGHGRRGLQRVYDQHSYQDEMRAGLELWAAKLRDIVTPPPANVTKLRRA